MYDKYSRDRDSRLRVIYMAITRNPKHIISQLTVMTKILNRRLKRLPVFAQCALFVSLFMCVLIYGSIFMWLFGNPLKRDSFLEVEKCPACFGFSLCEAAHDGKVWFTGLSKIRILDYINFRNVYTGIADGNTVHLKRLGSNREITAWETRLCLMGREPAGCDVGSAAVRALTASGTRWLTSHTRGLSNMTVCPTERYIERIMDRYREKRDSIDLSARERISLVSTLMLNQEPVLFQTFPRAEGWPFASYIGACGRYVAIDADLKPLYDFHEADWLVRAQLALKLLKMAEQLTENKPQYGIYFTELTYMTFGVDKKTDVVIVDGRNIAVVDRFQITLDKNGDWDKPLYSQFDECGSSSEFCPMSSSDTSQLCYRHVTDRNYYAVCRYILSNYAVHNGRNIGLLSRVPAEIEPLYAISELADSCARPAQPHQRHDKVIELIKALMDVVGPQAPQQVEKGAKNSNN